MKKARSSYEDKLSPDSSDMARSGDWAGLLRFPKRYRWLECSDVSSNLVDNDFLHLHDMEIVVQRLDFPPHGQILAHQFRFPHYLSELDIRICR
jgi:hypothetical protein